MTAANFCLNENITYQGDQPPFPSGTYLQTLAPLRPGFLDIPISLFDPWQETFAQGEQANDGLYFVMSHTLGDKKRFILHRKTHQQ
jgi:hypothetical protein